VLTPTPDDLRAEIARQRVHVYRVAARIGLHRVNLSRALHGHAALSADRAREILRAIAEEATARDASATRALRRAKRCP
jgi:DNA-binding transcriptional regulator YdaS (Cro superfamily)